MQGAQAQAALCPANAFWADCAKNVKAAIKATNDPKEALQLAAMWAERYELLYKANAQTTWPLSDEERLTSGMEGLWDETIGKNLDPTGLALDAALKRYIPRLAAVVELASGPYVAFFWNLIAPSPIANDFTAAKPDNAEINRLVMSKLPSPTAFTIRQLYPELFRKSYEATKGSGTLP
jgi:hypothetical protein